MAIAYRDRFLSCLLALAWLSATTGAAQTPESGQPVQRPLAPTDAAVHVVKPGKLRVVVNARGSIEAARAADVLCPLESQSTIILLAPEGGAVRKGDLVCELDSSALKDQLVNQEIAAQRAGAAYQNAKLAREVAEIAVTEYAEGIYKQELFALKSQIAGAEAAIEKAEDRLERTRRARKQIDETAGRSPGTPADIVAELEIADRLEAAQQSVQNERKALDLARAKQETLQKYTLEKTTKSLKVEVERKRTEELNRKEASSLEKSKSEKLGKQIVACRILAPISGVVVYANGPNRPRMVSRSQIEEGATVRSRQKIVSVFDLTGPMQVNLKVPERHVDRIAEGMRAKIVMEALPESVLTGVVSTVAPLPDPTNFITQNIKVYTTIVRLDNRQPDLRPGMTARAEILVRELDNVLNVPIEAVVRFENKDRVALRQPEGGFNWREVVLGLASDQEVEIKEGLKAGDVVTLLPTALLTEEQNQQLDRSGSRPQRQVPNPRRRASGS
jgi:RND family efflux transporter MFP subunit